MRATREAQGQVTINRTPRVRGTGVIQPTQRASSRGGTQRPLARARPGCIEHHGKRQPEPWKQPVTGELVHSAGGGCLPSSEAPQPKPQV